MKKLLLLSLFVVISSLYATAQRKTIYVEQLTTNTGVPQEWLNDIHSQIIRTIDTMGRATAMSENSKSSSTQADYIIRGNITKAICDIKAGKNPGEDSYFAEYEGKIQFIEANTGTILADKILRNSGICRIRQPRIPRQDKNYRKEVRRLEDEAANKAYDSALNSNCYILNSIIDENIKIEVNISGITQVKGDEIRYVTIDKGTYNGVTDGERFNVSVVETIGNYPSVTKIAEIKVSEQPTQNAAQCKVVSGKKELKQAMDAGKVLSVVSRTAKLFD